LPVRVRSDRFRVVRLDAVKPVAFASSFRFFKVRVATPLALTPVAAPVTSRFWTVTFVAGAVMVTPLPEAGWTTAVGGLPGTPVKVRFLLIVTFSA
jgi:hypothetical protein